jgi:hypothetical protein
VASSPTPESWVDGEPRSWGPVEERHRLRVHRVADLVANRLGKPIGEIAEMLLAMPTRHRYLLLRRLGRTGHSTVYGAVDQLLAREVALKLHHEDVGDDGDWRVLGEARTMSLVEHPNIVRIFDVGVHEGTMYSVTELCEADMTTWAKGRAWGDVVDRIVEAGRGLAALHAANIVHGDIKPANLLVRDGVAKVADFGMATRPGLNTRVGGTAGYIAPEVADGLRSPAGDVFALAATAWACLFGRPAFGMPPQMDDRYAALMVLVERARNNEIEIPPAKNVPRRVVSVLRRGLEPDPFYRPELEHWLAQLGACRPLANRWRSAEVPHASSVAVLGCVLVVLGAAGHALYSAHTVIEPDGPLVDVPASAKLDPVLPTSPCALGEDIGVSVDIDPVVLDVCQQIRNSELQAATDAWNVEYDRRRSTTGADELAADTRIVARTFFHQAEVITRTEQFQHDGRTLTATEQQTLAREAAGHATLWLEHSLNPPPE